MYPTLIRAFAVTLLLFSLSAAASTRSPRANCLSSQVERLQSEDFTPTSAAPLAIKPWSFRARDLTLTPEQLLPADYLARVREKIGPIKLTVSKGRSRIYFRVSAGRHWYKRNSLVAEFYLEPDSGQTGAVRIDGLQLQDPLSDKTTRLHLSQSRKGLPPNVFRHIRDRIFDLAQAAGYRTLTASGADNYAVHTLYRKFVGMTPSHPAGASIIWMLDDLYRFAKTTLPEPYRPKDLDAFARILGDVAFSSIDSDTRVRINSFVKTGKLPKGLELIRRNGRIIGYIDTNELPEGLPHVVFVYLNKIDRPIQWYDFRHPEFARLQRSLENGSN